MLPVSTNEIDKGSICLCARDGMGRHANGPTAGTPYGKAFSVDGAALGALAGKAAHGVSSSSASARARDMWGSRSMTRCSATSAILSAARCPPSRREGFVSDIADFRSLRTRRSVSARGTCAVQSRDHSKSLPGQVHPSIALGSFFICALAHAAARFGGHPRKY